MGVVSWIALILVIIGAINWGLVGFFGFDLVSAIFGPMSGLTRIVYDVIGLAGIYVAVMLPRMLSRA